MKKIAILQSNYIPWKGYFDLIAAVDEFIIYDDMQYTKNDWRNRNKVKTPNGAAWLTVPVRNLSLEQKICKTKVANNLWRKKHWKTLIANYGKTDGFKLYKEIFEDLYLASSETSLTVINLTFIKCICKILNIRTKIVPKSGVDFSLGKTERLVDICLRANGTEYISGPAAQNYLDESCFTKNDIKLTWFNYDGYPEYQQLWGDFIHGVSIIDLLFNCGNDAAKFMKYV